MTDHDFIFISGFIEKAFEFVMAATMIASGTYLVKFFTLKQFIYQFTHYSLVLEQLSGLVTIYNTNTQVDGSIGIVLDQIKNHYVIQLHDRVLTIGKENVKKTSNVELYGLESAEFNGERGKIKKYNPKTQRYTIQLDKDSSKRTVKRQNVKGIGGTKKYKRY